MYDVCSDNSNKTERYGTLHHLSHKEIAQAKCHKLSESIFQHKFSMLCQLMCSVLLSVLPFLNLVFEGSLLAVENIQPISSRV